MGVGHRRLFGWLHDHLQNNITGVDAGAGGTAIAAGGKVLILGVVGDLAYQRLSFPASVTTVYGDGDIVLVHPYFGEPWYFEADNATSAGFLLNVVCAYINK